MVTSTMAEKPHIVVFPFMSQGHLRPFLALAKLIEERTSCTITLVNTPLNIQALQSSIPPSSAIRLAALPFNSTDHGLPPDTENTDSIPLPLFYNFFKASLTLQPAFEKLLADLSQRDGRPPVCIISDIFFGWTAEIAERLGIYHTVFIASGAYGTAIYFSIWLHRPQKHGDLDVFSLPDFPESGLIYGSQLPPHVMNAEETDWSFCYHRQVFSGSLRSDALLFNTVEGLEATGLGYFSRTTDRPVWAIGPITWNHQRGEKKRSENSTSTNACISWLDQQPPCSVLYISFGSQLTISPPQMKELAIGLESSRQKFIWVVRPPSGFHVNGEFRLECLPEGFEDRVAESKQGILVWEWAPQTEILAHGSTGAFLSHCGWNSLLESLRNGVPVIGWPLGGEQFFNSKAMAEEVGVCVEVARGMYGKVESGRVAEVIGMVMGETEKGKEMRRTASRMKEMMGEAVREDGEFKGSSVRAMDDFIATCSEYSRGRDKQSICIDSSS